ncbi:MAG TPA: sigma-70 family RNA polymerase sigma factor [Verrucomicrobiae bacterium]|nr:sigma-70 family RNA polymerase sigma factor [Verrucomicrobiae bacterium]
MLIFNLKTRQKLWRIVRQLSGDSAAHDDLMQEAMLHLWQREIQTPAQTQSWYLQSCRFHLLGYLNRGRSVDSFKRRQDQCASQEEAELAQSLSGSRTDGESPLDCVCVLDIIESLSKKLNGREKDILGQLIQGAGTREIARKLSISHQSVSKHRQKLAALAIKIGISPLPQPNSRYGASLSER